MQVLKQTLVSTATINTQQCTTAPELLACEGYGETVDMWSVGVMLYVL